MGTFWDVIHWSPKFWRVDPQVNAHWSSGQPMGKSELPPWVLATKQGKQILLNQSIVLPSKSACLKETGRLLVVVFSLNQLD